MKDRYRIYVCEDCEEHFQFAGFCDSCNKRLTPVMMVPLPLLQARGLADGSGVLSPPSYEVG